MKREQHTIAVDAKKTVSSEWLIPEQYNSILIIAHGAGNDMHSEFISYLHENFAKKGILTVKFNFPYKEQAKKAPDSPKILQQTWRSVIAEVYAITQCRPYQIFISGKSLGGRYASMIASELSDLGGLLYFGYPLHSPGKKEKTKSEHLEKVRFPMLFIQGSRDSLCDIDTLNTVLTQLPIPPDLHVILGADHSFKVLKKLDRTNESVWGEIVDTGAQWIKQLSP